MQMDFMPRLLPLPLPVLLFIPVFKISRNNIELPSVVSERLLWHFHNQRNSQFTKISAHPLSLSSRPSIKYPAQ